MPESLGLWMGFLEINPSKYSLQNISLHVQTKTPAPVKELPCGGYVAAGTCCTFAIQVFRMSSCDSAAKRS